MLQGYWVRFILIYAYGMLGISTLGMSGPLVGDLAGVLGSPASVVGMALGLQAVVGALSGTLLGGLIDRWGSKPMLVAGALFVVVGDTSAYLTPNMLGFAAALLVQSTGLAILLSTGQASVTALATGAQQARGLAFWSTLGFFGFAFGLLIGGIFGGSPGWRYAFLVHAGIGGFLLLLSPALPNFKGAARRESFLAVLGERKVVAMALAFVLVATTSMGINAAISQYLHVVHGVPMPVAASSAALGNVLALLGSVVMGVVLGRGGNVGRALLVLAVVGVVAGSMAHLPSLPFTGAVVAFYIFQILASAVVAFIYATMPRVLVEQGRIGAATGMLVQSGAVAAMLGAPVFFWVTGTGSWVAITSVIALCWIGTYFLLPVREIASKGALSRGEALAGH